MSRSATVDSKGSGTVQQSEDRDTFLELYRRMRLIRRFEDGVQALFTKGAVHGTTHLYSGQEANAVAVGSLVGANDRVAGTYRGHGHALALGVSPQALMDELLGRSTGICGGRAGSMNIVDLEHGLIGCFGIIGGSMAAATGAALSTRRDGGVAVAFFGDGTVNHGYFHECLNFAKVYSLPVVYVCENNRYGEFTPFEQVTAGSIQGRPATFGIPSETIDGNDVFVVREAAASAFDRARAGDGPQFIECLTYRFVGHSRSDPGKYRKPGELEEWKLRDPLIVARNGLVKRYGVPDQTLDQIDAEVDAEIGEIQERAQAAPFPDPQSASGTEFKP